MRDDLLTAEERERIRRCVEEAEKSTSGEIVPMVVPASHHYPVASLLGALIAGLLLAVAATAVANARRPWGPFTALDLWLFPAVFAVSFVAAYELIRRVAGLKRLFVTPSELQDEVDEAALTSFYREGLAGTRDRTGILIFVSVFERRACVLADKGINEKVPPGAWQELVDLVTKGFRDGKRADAICGAVTRCGQMLSEHFPIKPDDTNELKNLITEPSGPGRPTPRCLRAFPQLSCRALRDDDPRAAARPGKLGRRQRGLQHIDRQQVGVGGDPPLHRLHGGGGDSEVRHHDVGLALQPVERPLEGSLVERAAVEENLDRRGLLLVVRLVVGRGVAHVEALAVDHPAVHRGRAGRATPSSCRGHRGGWSCGRTRGSRGGRSGERRRRRGSRSSSAGGRAFRGTR